MLRQRHADDVKLLVTAGKTSSDPEWLEWVDRQANWRMEAVEKARAGSQATPAVEDEAQPTDDSTTSSDT